MATCPLCEKRFIDRRGLHGHFRFVHGIEYGSGKPAKKTALTEATREIVERRRKGVELADRLNRGEIEVTPTSKGEREEGERGKGGHRFLFIEKEKVGMENGKEIGKNRGHRFSFVE